MTVDVNYLDPQGIEPSLSELGIEFFNVQLHGCGVAFADGLSIVPVSNDSFIIHCGDVRHCVFGSDRSCNPHSFVCVAKVLVDE